MAQVKFYSVAASAEKSDANGIYFVTGGELYKGTSRFGANKVWTTKPDENAGVIGGDLYINAGVTEVFDGVGKSWVSITNTNGWTSVSFGGEGSYIQAVSQGTDGAITATAVAFPTLATGTSAGTVKLGNGEDVSVQGWDTLVASVSANASDIATNASSIASNSSAISALDSRVSAIESIVDASNNSVTAGSGTFTDLTVSTANFTATSVAASTLTIGGSTVNQIAQAEIGAVTANTITATGTSLPTESAVATYVSAAVSNLAGAMHFRGTATITKSGEAITVSNFSETFEPAGGDVVVDTANNLEAVYTGSAWELLGSNSVYALDAYAPGTESVTSATTTLGGAVHAIAAQVDTLTTSFGNLGTAASKDYADSLTTTGTSLPTESAVAGYVTSVVEGLDASVSSSENASIQVGVTQVDGVVTGVTADLVWLGADGTALT